MVRHDCWIISEAVFGSDLQTIILLVLVDTSGGEDLLPTELWIFVIEEPLHVVSLGSSELLPDLILPSSEDHPVVVVLQLHGGLVESVTLHDLVLQLLSQPWAVPATHRDLLLRDEHIQDGLDLVVEDVDGLIDIRTTIDLENIAEVKELCEMLWINF